MLREKDERYVELAADEGYGLPMDDTAPADIVETQMTAAPALPGAATPSYDQVIRSQETESNEYQYSRNADALEDGGPAGDGSPTQENPMLQIT